MNLLMLHIILALAGVVICVSIIVNDRFIRAVSSIFGALTTYTHVYFLCHRSVNSDEFSVNITICCV